MPSILKAHHIMNFFKKAKLTDTYDMQSMPSPILTEKQRAQLEKIEKNWKEYLRLNPPPQLSRGQS